MVASHKNIEFIIHNNASSSEKNPIPVVLLNHSPQSIGICLELFPDCSFL